MVGEILETILNLPKYYDELGAALKARVQEDFGRFGILLEDCFINSITPPVEVQKMIDEKSGMGAVGDLDKFMKYKAAKAMGDAASQTAASGDGNAAGTGMGLGLGAGLGMMMPGILQQSMQATAQGRLQKIECPKCHAQIEADSRYCPHCGHQIIIENKCPHCGKNVPAKAKFCMYCGAKLEKIKATCPYCGAEILPGSLFCNSCGKKIN